MEMIKHLDYDGYWKRWLTICVEGIIKESAEREKRYNQQHNPLDQDYRYFDQECQDAGTNN